MGLSGMDGPPQELQDAAVRGLDRAIATYHSLWDSRMRSHRVSSPSDPGPAEGRIAAMQRKEQDAFRGIEPWRRAVEILCGPDRAALPDWYRHRFEGSLPYTGKGKDPMPDDDELQSTLDRNFPVLRPEGRLLQDAITGYQRPRIIREPDAYSISLCAILGAALGMLINEAWHDYTDSELEHKRPTKPRPNKEQASRSAKRLQGAKS